MFIAAAFIYIQGQEGHNCHIKKTTVIAVTAAQRAKKGSCGDKMTHTSKRISAFTVEAKGEESS